MKCAILSVVAVVLLSFQPVASAAADPAARALNMTLPEMKFQNVTLGDAIDFVRDVSSANIHVNWRALEAINVSKDTTVNMRLRSVPLRKVLSLLVSESGAPDQVTWYVDQGVIEITTRELADKQLVTRVYPVDDLILEIPDFEGYDLGLQDHGKRGSGGGGGSSRRGGGGGNSSGLFGGGNSGTGTNSNQPATKTERADALVKLIQETIYPEIWRDAGGTASIKYFNGNLIVTAPRSVHEAIAGVVD